MPPAAHSLRRATQQKNANCGDQSRPYLTAIGRPVHEARRYYTSFSYQAQGKKPLPSRLYGSSGTPALNQRIRALAARDTRLGRKLVALNAPKT